MLQYVPALKRVDTPIWRLNFPLLSLKSFKGHLLNLFASENWSKINSSHLKLEVKDNSSLRSLLRRSQLLRCFGPPPLSEQNGASRLGCSAEGGWRGCEGMAGRERKGHLRGYMAGSINDILYSFTSPCLKKAKKPGMKFMLTIKLVRISQPRQPQPPGPRISGQDSASAVRLVIKRWSMGWWLNAKLLWFRVKARASWNPQMTQKTRYRDLLCSRLHECCRHVEAEVITNSRNRLHQTWSTDFSQSLHIPIKPWILLRISMRRKN